MESSQLNIVDFGLENEVSALFMLAAEVETTTLSQMKDYAAAGQFYYEAAKNVVL